MIVESLVGAALVLLQLVAYNVSLARAVWMAGHLVSTFLLLGAIALTAWWASGGEWLRLRKQGWVLWTQVFAAIAMFVLGASGAITALGDTLVFGGGISPTESTLVARLVDLRIYHPILALITGGFVALAAWTARVQRPSAATRWLSTAIWVVYGLNLVLGAVNVALKAPVWIQIVHLLITDTIWILLVLLGAAALDHRLAEAEPMPEVSEALDAGATVRGY
jgi:heme A synthase